MNTILNMIFNKKRHWYTLKFEYYIGTRQVFSFHTQIGSFNKDAVVNDVRSLKKVVHDRIYNDQMKPILNNGQLTCIAICYLGKFRLRKHFSIKQIIDDVVLFNTLQLCERFKP
jgi:hypothetical protein